jgi:hypothetical protein
VPEKDVLPHTEMTNDLPRNFDHIGFVELKSRLAVGAIVLMEALDAGR